MATGYVNRRFNNEYRHEKDVVNVQKDSYLYMQAQIETHYIYFFHKVISLSITLSNLNKHTTIIVRFSVRTQIEVLHK